VIKKITDKETGEVELRVMRPLNMREMEEIRKLAVDYGDPSYNGRYMSQYKKVIDKLAEETGGDLYKAARQARRKHAAEYENPKSIAKLLADDETGRTVALEKVWQTSVLGGSVAELELLRNTVLKHPDKRVRQAGKKAWKDLGAETVAYIRAQSVKEKSSPNQLGQIQLSPSALRATMERIGVKKLEMLLGKETVKKLNQIADVATDVGTMPPYKGGSSTVINALSVFDKTLSRFLPAKAQVAVGAAKALAESGKAPAQVKKALAHAQPKTVIRDRAFDSENQGAIRRREAESRKRTSQLLPLSAVGLPMAEDRRRDKELRRSQGWAY